MVKICSLIKPIFFALFVLVFLTEPVISEEDSWVVSDIRISGLQRVSAGSVLPNGISLPLENETSPSITIRHANVSTACRSLNGNALISRKRPPSKKLHLKKQNPCMP